MKEKEKKTRRAELVGSSIPEGTFTSVKGSTRAVEHGRQEKKDSKGRKETVLPNHKPYKIN